MCKYTDFCFLLSKSKVFCPWFCCVTWARNFERVLNNEVERQHFCLLLDFNEIAPTFSLLGVILDMSLVRIPLVCLRCIYSFQFSHCSVISNCLKPRGLQRGQASLSFNKSWSLLKLMSIMSVIPSNHLILCHPLLLLPLIFLSIKVFSNESVLRIRWPKYWSFSFSISPSNKYSGLCMYYEFLKNIKYYLILFKKSTQMIRQFFSLKFAGINYVTS